MNKEIKGETIFSFYLIAVLSVVGLFLLYSGFHYYWIELNHRIPDASSRGLFGDSFGALNVFVSALAFTVLSIALILQTKELSLQRKDLRITQEQIKGQSEIFKIQQFENTFFNLISLLNELVGGVLYIFDSSEGTTEYHGRVALRIIFNEIFYKKYKEFDENRDNDEYANVTEKDMIDRSFDEVAKKHDVLHILLTVTRIISFIEVSKEKQEDFYFEVLLSQMSAHECAFLLYYYISSKCSAKEKKNLYIFMKRLTIPDSSLIYPQHRILIEQNLRESLVK